MWPAKGDSFPKEDKTDPSTWKVTVIVFWDSHGVVLIDYIEKGKNNYRGILRIITRQAEGRKYKETIAFEEEENFVPPRQRIISHFNGYAWNWGLN